MGKDCNLPKPSAKFRVEYFPGRGWMVMNPEGVAVTGPFGDRNKAEMSRDSRQALLDAKAKRGVRACMCCGHPFTSEGIHNRMCNDCRQRHVAPDVTKTPHRYRGGPAERPQVVR